MIDAGPTVLTMRHVFEAIFADAGSRLETAVALDPLSVLARHSWLEPDGEEPAVLDLFADRAATHKAIAAFAGPAEAERHARFCDQARDIHATLESRFMTTERPGQARLVLEAGVAAMFRTQPFASLWSILSKSFTDARLRQLYGRYATYCGSSPYLAPATLRLIAHVEQQGVWSVRGGMHQLARALADLIEKAGGRIRYSSPAKRIDVAEGRVTSVETSRGETIPADAVIANVDTNALATGLFGAEVRRAVPPTRTLQRSLSAVTFAMVARTEGFDLSRHNVFFSRDYRAEFDDLAAGRIPREPTIYVCAQDRVPGLPHPAGEPEGLLVLINAPPKGDTATMTTEETASCQAMTFALLARHGLRVRPECRRW